MNITYTDKKQISSSQSWQIQHNLIIKLDSMRKSISQAADSMLFGIMVGAKYNGRPFEYFTDMLSKYVKR